MKYWFTVFLVGMVFLCGANAQNTQQLRQDLQRIKDDYKNEMKKIWDEINRLQKDQSDAKVQLQQDFDATIQKYLKESGKDPLTWQDIITPQNKIKFYGFINLTMAYDTNRTDSGNTARFVLDNSLPGNDEELNIHARYTRFGMELQGTRLSTIGNPELSGKIEIDFNNGGPESRNLIRMRHAYLQLKWTEYDLSLLAGQTADIISPLVPETHEIAGRFRDRGNIGDRRPQLRIEWAPAIVKGTKEEETRLFLTAGILRAGSGDALDADADGNNDGEDSGAPMLQFRLGIATPGWVEGKKIRFGIGTSHSWYDTQVRLGARGEKDFKSHVWAMDLHLPITERIEFSSELWWGYNVSDLRGGIAQGIDTAKGDEVEATGGWFNLKVKTTERSSMVIGYAFDNPVDGDVPGRRLMNETYWINNSWDLSNGVSVGVEYQYMRTRYTRGDSNHNNRFVTYIMYTF